MFQSEEHWKSHMQRKHLEEFKKKEAQALFQMMTNVILQQQATQQIQFINKQKALSDQFLLLEQNKQIMDREFCTFSRLEDNVEKEIANMNTHFQKEVVQVTLQFQDNLVKVKEQNNSCVKSNHEQINKVVEHMQLKLKSQDYQISKIQTQIEKEQALQKSHVSQVQSNYGSQPVDASQKHSQRQIEFKNVHSEKIQEIEQFEDNEEIQKANQQLIDIKDFELQVQKFQTMTLQVLMNRNIGKQPEYTNYEKAKVIVDLDQLIDDELLKILSKTCVQLEDEQINDLDMILHKLKEENIHYEMNARMKMKFDNPDYQSNEKESSEEEVREQHRNKTSADLSDQDKQHHEKQNSGSDQEPDIPESDTSELFRQNQQSQLNDAFVPIAESPKRAKKTRFQDQIDESDDDDNYNRQRYIAKNLLQI